MVMSPAEVERYCAKHDDTWAILLIRDASGQQLKRFGKQ